MRKISCILVFLCSLTVQAQTRSSLSADKWVDSVFKTLSDDQKIAQLMVVRASGMDPQTRKVIFYEKEVADAISKYNIGGICLFQGGPLAQAAHINYFQGIARTPLLVCIDAENGVGMRMDSVAGLPRQMMLGAVKDSSLIYDYGRLVGAQCRRIGIQVNYAPVVDINNNPDNPVINDRSFGEDKYKVAAYGVQYVKGLQEAGVMACAKHFPGHGDVSVDSHLDLPVINKTKKQLDTLELYPFRALFREGVGSVMIAHLYIPDIDNTPNLATSLSYKNVTRLLRKKMKYGGISFTDALEMKGVTKYFPDGEASVQSLIAGNDMLCLPGDLEASMQKIREAILNRDLKWKDLNRRVKKVLLAKYVYGLANLQPIATEHLTEDLNRDVRSMRKRVAEQALTLLRNEEPGVYPVTTGTKKRIAYLGIGLTGDNEFARRMRNDYHAHVYYFDYGLDSAKAEAAAELLKNRYDLVVIGLHNYNRFPANEFGISKAAFSLISKVQQQQKAITVVFGNPYVMKHFCEARTLIACYEDDDITQATAADMLNGRFPARGKLPVTVCASLRYGTGIFNSNRLLPSVSPSSIGFEPRALQAIDSVCLDAISRQAMPGCVVLVARNGQIAYEKSYGYLTYDNTEPVYPGTIYDLASVTKICASTMAVMKLYDEGRLDLGQTLGYYLPWVRGSDKDTLKVRDLLLHQAGLKAFIPFSLETISPGKEGIPLTSVYSWKPDSLHSLRVAENLYMRHDWLDTINRRILDSKLGPPGKYVYSDNDFIFTGKIVEAITGMPLDKYVSRTFYEPLGLETTGFRPRDRFSLNLIAPTEQEQVFRRQLLRGDVHDPGAAMFGGVSGHAGLFSNAYDLAVLMQMLLNGGTFNEHSYLRRQTIDSFSSYHSDISRRGLGFDKPEKDNAVSKDPYPSKFSSPLTFGHTGFTGTSVWVDPKYQLIVILLSNRVNPTGGDNMKISTLSVRRNILDAVYRAMGVADPEPVAMPVTH